MGGSNNLLAKHNRAMAHISFMSLQQERDQDIQDFRDQYMAICIVCSELGLRFGHSKDEAKAILAQERSGKKNDYWSSHQIQ